MVKSELEKMIREIVRKEAKMALYEALSELFADGVKPKVPESKPFHNIIPKKPMSINKPIQERVFVKDPGLNAILNETAASPRTRERMQQMSSGAAVAQMEEQSNIGSSFVSNSSEVEEVVFQSSTVPELPDLFKNKNLSAILQKSIEKSGKKLG
jgi:hypothetical protein